MDEERHHHHHHSEHSEHHHAHSEHHHSERHHTPEPEADAAPEQPSKRKLWKEAKKRQHKARREYYCNAPWLVRAWKFCLRYIVIVLLLAVLALAAFVHSGLAVKLLDSYIDRVKDDPVSKETIYTMSPIDEEGAARIEATEPYGEDDTWTVCVYFVGSSREDGCKNELSELTKLMTEPLKEKNNEQRRELERKYLNALLGELKEKGLEMPEYLCQPVKSASESEENIFAGSGGDASDDIAEITSGVWGDNITVVLQTGGAGCWANSMINPNKTQRFTYKNGVFSKTSELPLQNSCAPETLSDFLRFCEKEYPADHKMLILWDHSGSGTGFGRDNIFGSSLSLKQLHQVLQTVYTPNQAAPAFDIVGFDAGLMAAAEVAHTFDGFASYLVASEELETDTGWNYASWLQALTDESTMNAVRAARAITDAYMDSSMAFNKNLAQLYGSSDAAMSVVDVHKAAQAYDAYCELCAAQLRDAAGDPGVLADIGRMAGSVTRYGKSDHDRINRVDLGGYMELLSAAYPDETRRVQIYLKDAVLYHRQSRGLADSQGLSVYLPARIGKFDALAHCLSFAYDASENEDVRALYYYLTAGCLNEEMSERAEALAGRKPKVLDIRPFRDFANIPPVMEANGWIVPVKTPLLGMIRSAALELASYNADTDSVICYGRDNFVLTNTESGLVNSFDGRWVALDGALLSPEVISSSASTVEYRSKVKCRDEYFYLLFTYDRTGGEFTVTGLEKIVTGGDALPTPGSKITDTILAGRVITPVYSSHNLKSGRETEVSGRMIFLTGRSKIEMASLPDGTYLSSIVISDPRGDSYCSGTVEQTYVGGHVIAQKAATELSQ